MKTLTGAVVLIGVLFAFTTGTAAEKLYKWVDANGNVHFSDRPPEASTDAQEIEVDAEISADRQREALNRQRATQTAVSQRQLAKIERAKEDARLTQERQKTAAESQIRCAQARSNLAVVERAAPAYSVNDAGQREYLEDAGRDQKLAQFRQAIRQFCDKG
ncbi:MAG: DUF4124 domain-containing protein [Lysobacterales bacterium]